MKITIAHNRPIIAPVSVQLLDENGELQEAVGKLHWKRLPQAKVGELIANEHAAANDSAGRYIFDEAVIEQRMQERGYSTQQELSIAAAVHARIFVQLIDGWDFVQGDGSPLPCDEKTIVDALTGPEGPRLSRGFYASLAIAYGIDPKGNVIETVPEEAAKN